MTDGAALVRQERDEFHAGLIEGGTLTAYWRNLLLPMFASYHQQYLHKNPNGYCGISGTGVSCPVGLASADG